MNELRALVAIVVLLVVLYLGLAAYLDHPTVEVSITTHACVRAYGPKGPMSCKEAMKGSYEKVFVDF